MAVDIRDVLAQQPEINWMVARVKSINLSTKKLVLVVGNVGDSNSYTVSNASYLTSYSPRVGDIVHVLLHQRTGVLVFGTSNGTGYAQDLDGKYLTAAQGDARYLTQMQGDARYLKLTGGTLTGTLELFNAKLLLHRNAPGEVPAAMWLAPTFSADAQYALSVLNQTQTGQAPALVGPSTDPAAAVRQDEVFTDWGTYISDWNAATVPNRVYYSNINTANQPSSGLLHEFHGVTIARANGQWLVQLAWPYNCRHVSVPGSVMYVRDHSNYGWSNWARAMNYVHSFGTQDGFTGYRHADKTRFAAGCRTGGTDGNPSENDQYRIQVYNLSGGYRGNAMVITESATVQFPGGHARMAAAMGTTSEVPADHAATVGIVAEMILNALTRAGLLDPRAKMTAADLLGINVTEASPFADPDYQDDEEVP